MKQKLTELKGEIDKFTIVAGGLIHPQPATEKKTNRQSRRIWKVWTRQLINSTWLTIYRTHHNNNTCGTSLKEPCLSVDYRNIFLECQFDLPKVIFGASLHINFFMIAPGIPLCIYNLLVYWCSLFIMQVKNRNLFPLMSLCSPSFTVSLS